MCFSGLFGGGGSSSSKIAKQARADEDARQTRIRAGMGDIDSAFAGFDDDYYSGRARAYTDYADPQIDRQHDEARRQLIFALSRSGNLDSSAANRDNANLERDTNEARVTAANTGLDLANRTRADVEGARSNLVAQLSATGDSSASSTAALREAQRIAQPAGYSPLGSLFSTFMSNLSAIGSNPSNGFAGFFPQSPKPGYATSGKGSARVVG